MSTPACADCGSTGALVERRGKLVCEWCAHRYWPITPAERDEIGPTPSLAILRAALTLAAHDHLSGPIDHDQLVAFEATWWRLPHEQRARWLATASTAVRAALDVEHMAAVYGDAQFGPGGWDGAPAVIRNDIWNYMQRVIDAVVGES